MKKLTARSHFAPMVPNFMTPTRIDYIDTPLYLIELSEGEFMRREIFGVTVASLDGKSLPDKSSKFDSLKEARDYIKELSSDS